MADARPKPVLRANTTRQTPPRGAWSDWSASLVQVFQIKLRLVNGLMESGQATSAAPTSPPATAKRAEASARPHRTIKLGIDVHLDR